MALRLARLLSQVRGFQYHLPAGKTGAGKPIVILLHGLGGDCRDWRSPLQDRNWPYDHRKGPPEVDLGFHSAPPIAKLPGIETKLFLSPRMAGNSRGHDGSDDRSWWHALIHEGYTVFTYTQSGALMVPFSDGPVAEFKEFMRTLQEDVLSDPSLRSRQVVLLGHSRGGLIARALLGDREVKADHTVGHFPRVTGLITLSSPHQGSQMALLDDKIIGFLDTIQKVVPALPNDVGSHVINALKIKVDNYVGAHGDEIEPGSPLFRSLVAQEPIKEGVRVVSVGGTSPRLLRLYFWTFTADSAVPKKSPSGKTQFRWRARPREARGVSPIPDGLPLKLLGLDLDEVIPGRGDGLTADKRCRFPDSFRAAEHMSVALSHAEELWDQALQTAIIQRLETFC
jgi:pimeloyl-ACP methyl ester carboxylesterase